jgi:hypothetical protein
MVFGYRANAARLLERVKYQGNLVKEVQDIHPDLATRSINNQTNYQAHKDRVPKDPILIYSITGSTPSNIHSEEQISLGQGLFSK